MPQRSDSFVIEQSFPRGRIDTYLRAHYPAVSRGTIQRLLEQGHIQVNGRVVKPTHHPRAGEEVTLRWPEPKPMAAQPESIPLEILYEDNELVVVNKPAGLITHPGTGHEEHTLVNALLYHCQGRLSGIGGVLRPGIVHRLDKDTSGCLVVAKNDHAHMTLQRQFAERSLEKIYLAIACGELPLDEGEIRASIARHPTERKRMAAVPEERGRQARTSYRIRERLRGATCVEAVLHTGRTHQIRVHFLHLGFPLLGDPIYGRRQTQRVEGETGFTPPRLMLHAWKLAFLHPVSERLLAFEAPVPEDIRDALKTLR
jgi:23S rRNA pseudouridine1911/1915/1917 synthase